MTTGHHIQYLANANIDKQQWDACIANASNSLVYAQSFYLDTMAKGWSALVLNNYEAVMPLPWRKKAGFPYLFQPPITPTLGIFGNDITPDLVSAFLAAIPAAFKLWDISLNRLNPLPLSQVYPVFKRNNFVLSLDSSYEQLQVQYHQNIKRNTAKAIKKGCIVKKDVPIADVIQICRQQFPSFMKVERGLFEKLETIFLHSQPQARTYCVVNEEGKKLSAAAFLFSRGRAYYWLVGNDPESRDSGASALLIDAFIREHAGQNLLLDFEGSDDKGVAGFYKKFGAVAETFTTIYHNLLPFPVSLLKPLPAHYRGLSS
ncbi:MAG TPA: hypothetical protein VLD19_07130 [Chitinophagaceae bacterium]|nr:hypothetical protein [Chitinophagaceae bacterium]